MTQSAITKPPESGSASNAPDRKPALKVAADANARRADLLPPAEPAVPRRRFRARHHGIWLSFLLTVIAPTVASIHYLYTYAADQYASTVAFSVRTEEVSSPLELLGGLGQISGASSSDTDILYAFLLSQEMVEGADAALDLRAIYSQPAGDPVFTFDPDQPVEDLIDYWEDMVAVAYDPATGLIEVEARAFAAEDAQAISTEIEVQSAALIDRLSKIARDDAIRFAKEELDSAAARLKETRLKLTAFRDQTQIVDPTAALEARGGVLMALEQQLAEALIENDLLIGVTRSEDPRLDQLSRRIEAIEARIVAEREKIGRGEGVQGGQVLTDIVGDYEGLLVDREFAEQAYIAALSTYDTALAEARRQSRYLAVHIQPTLAASPEYPDRMVLSMLVAAFLGLAWSIMVLFFYSLRDRQ